MHCFSDILSEHVSVRRLLQMLFIKNQCALCISALALAFHAYLYTYSSLYNALAPKTWNLEMRPNDAVLRRTPNMESDVGSYALETFCGYSFVYQTYFATRAYGDALVSSALQNYGMDYFSRMRSNSFA